MFHREVGASNNPRNNRSFFVDGCLHPKMKCQSLFFCDAQKNSAYSSQKFIAEMMIKHPLVFPALIDEIHFFFQENIDALLSLSLHGFGISIFQKSILFQRYVPLDLKDNKIGHKNFFRCNRGRDLGVGNK